MGFDGSHHGSHIAWSKINGSFWNGFMGSSSIAWVIDQWVGSRLMGITWVGSFDPGSFKAARRICRVWEAGLGSQSSAEPLGFCRTLVQLTFHYVKPSAEPCRTQKVPMNSAAGGAGPRLLRTCFPPKNSLSLDASMAPGGSTLWSREGQALETTVLWLTQSPINKAIPQCLYGGVQYRKASHTGDKHSSDLSKFQNHTEADITKEGRSKGRQILAFRLGRVW